MSGLPRAYPQATALGMYRNGKSVPAIAAEIGCRVETAHMLIDRSLREARRGNPQAPLPVRDPVKFRSR